MMRLRKNKINKITLLKQYKGFKINITNDTSDNYASIGELKLYTVDMSQFPNASQSTSKKYLPNLKDIFLRGNKQGRQLLSWQNDDNKKHNHRVPLNTSSGEGVLEYEDIISNSTLRQVYYPDNLLEDNSYGTPISQETFTGTESRPKNISVNYIIKAKNISSEDTISPVINEVNAKIEFNRKGLSDLKTEYENHLRGLNETKVLYTASTGSNGTRTLNETLKNFREVVIELTHTNGLYRGTFRFLTELLNFNDSANPGGESLDRYILTIYSNDFVHLIFRSNGLNIAEHWSGYAYVSKITGVGRVGGF